jgi:quinol monooxygenase YgiN
MKKVLFGMVAMMLTMFSCSQKTQTAQNAADSDSVIRVNFMVTVTPAVRDSVIALSKELVDSSRLDSGNISYDVLASATDPNLLMIMETWKNQASLDKHSAAPHFTRIVPAIQKIAKTDAQIFKKAEVDSTSALRLNCPHKINAQNHEAALALVKELVSSSKKQEGCIDYDVFLSLTDSTQVLIFETWQNQASLDKHSASDSFQKLVPAIDKLCESSSVEKFVMPKK